MNIGWSSKPKRRHDDSKGRVLLAHSTEVLLLICLVISLFPDSNHQAAAALSSFRFTQDGFGFSVLLSQNGSTSPMVGGNCTPPFDVSYGTMTAYNQWPDERFTQFVPGFQGGVFDGTYIWLAPQNGFPVVRIDPVTGNMKAYPISIGFNGGGYNGLGFCGGVFDGTYVWFVPSQSNQVVRLDPLSGNMTGYGAWPMNLTSVGNNAFSGGVFDGTFIWLVPNRANQVVRIYPLTGNMTGYSNWPAGLSIDGSFAGGVFDGTYIWLVPSNADQVIRIDQRSGNMTGYNIEVEFGIVSFIGGVFDGTYIWLVPSEVFRVVRLDPRTGNTTGYNGWPVNCTGGGYSFYGGVFDGTYVWLVPWSANQVVRIDPSTGNMTGYSGWPAGLTGIGDGAFASGVFNGTSIWLIPYSANEVVSIDLRCLQAAPSSPGGPTPYSTQSPPIPTPTQSPPTPPTTSTAPPTPNLTQLPPQTTEQPVTTGPTAGPWSVAPTNLPSKAPSPSPTPQSTGAPPLPVPNVQKKAVATVVVAVGVTSALGSLAPDLTLSILLGLSDCVHPYYRVLVDDAVDFLLPFDAVTDSQKVAATATLLAVFGLFLLCAAIFVAISKVCGRPKSVSARRYIFPVVPLSLASFYVPLFLFVTLRPPMDSASAHFVTVINLLVVALWLAGILFSAIRSQWLRTSPRVGGFRFLRRMFLPAVVGAPTGHGLETILQGVRGPLPGGTRGLAFYGRVFLVAIGQLVITVLAVTVSKPCGIQTIVVTVACVAMAFAIAILRPMTIPILNVLLAAGYVVLAAVAWAMVFAADEVVTALKFLLDALVFVRVLLSVVGRFLVRSVPVKFDETARLHDPMNRDIELND